MATHVRGRVDKIFDLCFEDGRCKVLSVGAVKSAECGMMHVGCGMVPLADPEVRFGSG